jgi:predicted MPP superfamily phosphohydrolase
MKAVWLTDIHLEFLDGRGVERFTREVREASPDAVLISGDIAQAGSLTDHLSRLAREIKAPIYFVLGNHDFYHGSIADVRARAMQLSADSISVHWLSAAAPVPLTSHTCLVGHDGWGDGRLGDFHASDVCLNDFRLISELIGLDRDGLVTMLHRLGDQAAAHFRAVLPIALESAAHVVVLTHVPPFLESSWYDGRYCDSDWLPFFSCRAVGDVLREFMLQHQNRRMTVLCGHTHGGGTSQILPNLKTVTGPACYGKPVIQSVFDWE